MNLRGGEVETATKAQNLHTLAVQKAGEQAVLDYYSKELKTVSEIELVKLMSQMSIGKIWVRLI